MGATEWRVWQRLRLGALDGWRFRRQHPIGPYYVDFYCPAARLVVEVQGPVHDFDVQGAYDKRRTAWLEADGFRVLEIRVEDIDSDLDEVIDGIHAELIQRAQEGFRQYRPQPHRRPAGDTSP